MLDLVRACYALRPDGIEWPLDDEGMPSFRLEKLTKANGVEHTNAHDAMSDVYATIEMAKLTKQKQPKLFHYFFENRGKKEIEKLINTAEMTPLVHVSGMLGNYRGNTTLIAPLAWHPTNKNAVIVCDLTANIDDLLIKSAEELRENLYTKKETLLETGMLPVPLKLIHINKCPIVAPEKTLLPQNAEHLGIDRALCMQNQQRLLASQDIRQKVMDIFQQEREFEASDNVETELYNGFFSDADKNNMAILRTLEPEKLAEHHLSFQDPRIPQLLFHYRARHFYRTLNRSEQIKWQKYCRKKLDSEILQFEQSLQALAAQHANNEEKLSLLQKVYEYGSKLIG